MERKQTRYAHCAGHTDVCYSENGDKLLTCGADGDIRIWTGFDDYDPFQTCVGEWSLCVLQKNNQILVATDSNNVQLLTYPVGERDGILTRFTAHVNHMAVGKNHDYVAVVVEDMEVKVLNLSVEKKYTTCINFFGLLGPPLSVALCPQAKLLAVSAGDGYLRIWEIEKQLLLKEINCVPKANSFMNAKLLCRVDFEPNDCKYLCYPDNTSVIILCITDFSVKMTLSDEAIQTSFSITQFSPCSKFVAAASDKGDIAVWNLSSQKLVGITSHPLKTAICSMVWNPLDNGEIAYCDVQGQLGIVINCKGSLAINSLTENEVDFGNIEFEDDDEDNENAISLEKLKNDIMGSPEMDHDTDKESVAPICRPPTPLVPLQQAFMPSSTPEHLNPRYLCWNEVGVVKSYGGTEDEDSQKSIEVDFHDVTFHNSMMVQNFMEYTMGSLSSTALVIANSSQFTALPLLSGTMEWMLKVDDNVDVVCISASQKLVCVATSNYLVHVCTTYGTQKAVFSIPGPVVTMSSFEETILIAYHMASARKEDQCINMMLVECNGFMVQSKMLPVPLGPECTLFWLGFTDLGTPAVFDSSGMLYLFPFKSNVWLPFCDTTKHHKNPADGFFITSVLESTLTLRGVLCKGTNYPGFTPRPTLSELPMQPPFLEIITEKSQLEANLFTWTALQVENSQRKCKEAALKAFALACKSNLDQRAIELTNILSDKQLLTLAVKYANKLQKRRLVEKLNNMLSKLNSNEDIKDTSCTESNYLISTRKLAVPSSSPSVSQNNIDTQQISSTTPSDHVSRNDSSLNSTALQELSNSPSVQSELKNPFLRKHNKIESQNSFAAFDKYSQPGNSNEAVNKRKHIETTSHDQSQKEKQRKLDRFLFSNRS